MSLEHEEGGAPTGTASTSTTTTTDQSARVTRRLPPGREQLEQDAQANRRRGAAAADEAAGDWWRSTADQALDAMAALGRAFTVDDLVERTGLPEATSPRAMGARVLRAARAGRIARVGYAPSRRPSARGAIVRVWRGVR